MVYNAFMLEGIFGNKNAERVLMHIYHYGESHASAIAQDYQIALMYLSVINTGRSDLAKRIRLIA
jgi:hypothetical protein